MMCLAVRPASARGIKDDVDAVSQHSNTAAKGLKDSYVAWRIGLPQYSDVS